MKLRLALIIALVAFCNAAAPEVTLLESNKDLRYALKMWCDEPLTATRTYGHISDWDLSLITDMSKLMRHCSTAESFNEDISRWNVANVTNMYGTFLGARAFNSDISSWKTQNLATLHGTFYGAKSFNQDISSWNVKKVGSLAFAFFYASAFNQDIGSWQIGKVTSLQATFFGATKFNQDITSWKTERVASLASTFNKATSFDRDISQWNVEKVSSMYETFKAAATFNQSLKWNIPLHVRTDNMFEGTAGACIDRLDGYVEDDNLFCAKK